MAKLSGAVLMGVICAGGYWAYTDYEAKRRITNKPKIVTVTNPAPQKSGGLDFTPLIGWGIDMLGKGSSNTKTGGGFDLSSIFGGNKKTDQGAGAWGGGGGGASVPAGLETSLLSLIGSLEAPQGYNQVYGGSVISPPRPITTMTVREVLAWQDRSVAAGSKSSAAGRYQIIRGTLRGLVNKGVVSMNDKFDRSTQDRLGLSLMKSRGLNSYKSGAMSAEKFAQNLSKEWASLPAMTKDKKGRPATGQSYYAGDGLNHALTSKQTVLATLKGGVYA